MILNIDDVSVAHVAGKIVWHVNTVWRKPNTVVSVYGQQLLLYDWQESFHQSLDGTISLSGARPSEEVAGGAQLQDNGVWE